MFQTLLSWISVNGAPNLTGSGWQLLGVSILVVVDLGQRLDKYSTSSTHVPWFQSLLSWISVNGLGVAASLTGPRCFNPCCRGSRSTAVHAVTAGTSMRQSFNPCCRGSRSTASEDRLRRNGGVSILVVVDLGQRRERRASCTPIPRFQSLLCWISVNGPNTSIDWSQNRFQSLLSWISVNGLIGIRTRHLKLKGFNPCCRGSRSTAWSHAGILRHDRSCFNPCCRGSRSTA